MANLFLSADLVYRKNFLRQESVLINEGKVLASGAGADRSQEFEKLFAQQVFNKVWTGVQQLIIRKISL